MDDELNSDIVIGIDHIGIAVKNIQEAQGMYRMLGFKKLHEGVLRDEKRDILVSFMSNNQVTIELVAPVDNNQKSIVDKYLGLNIGYAMYHVCYKVTDIEKAIEYFKEKKYIKMQEISIAQLMDNKREVYMFNRKMGVIELLEGE